MDENRKKAYRYVLYWALVEIRGIARNRFRWWNPFATGRDFRRARLAGDVADAMHNLGFFASIDFEGFDEQWFWRDLERVKARYTISPFERYQTIFTQRLEELEAKSSS